jgi:ribosomal protein S18 acetylase RimI-like enzyme
VDLAHDESKQRMLYEFPSLTDPAKKKGLKGQKNYYYVFFVGTDPNAQGQGMCSAIMRECQARAAKEGLPVWLEATTEKSMKIYSNLGWELVEEMVLGKGKAKADGALEKGGEGVKFWAMVWWPPATMGEI